ncbi:MAG TPA: peroxiredoxin [Blastocatellia bacterium]|nr:peroxiredoxin [Blastocatellia bacterium]
MKKTRILIVLIGLGIIALAPALTTAFSSMPEVGQSAPDFTLKNQDGKQVSLKDYKGKWIVLYFYPKDFTGGCTLEAHNFQRDIASYEKANAVILGVSVDTEDSHKSFCTKEGLSFKLLADTENKVSTTYGSIMEYQGNKLSARNTFLIDPQGKIARVFEKVKPPTHSEEVLAALAELQKK